MSNDDPGAWNSERNDGVPDGDDDGNRQRGEAFVQARRVEPAAAETQANPAADVRAALGRLAGTGQGSVLERAEAAIEDLDAAVAFVESCGLEELAAAIEATDDPAVRNRGERVLAEFRRFRRAARGEAVPACDEADSVRGVAHRYGGEADPARGGVDSVRGGVHSDRDGADSDRGGVDSDRGGVDSDRGGVDSDRGGVDSDRVNGTEDAGENDGRGADHFRRGRGTHLRSDAERTTQ